MTEPLISEASVVLSSPDIRARAGFRAAGSSTVAGGPLFLEFFAENLGQRALYVLSGGDRMRDRPADYAFTATLGGVPLRDPYGELPDIGGLGAFVVVARGETWQQQLLLNQFVAIEDTIHLLSPGASSRLRVRCTRPLPLASDEQEALASEPEAATVDVEVTVAVHRDDRQLAALVDQLVSTITSGPIEEREMSLRILLTLRARPAVDRWRRLAEHPDASVAERVTEALALVQRLARDS